jgi:hypothetical protein
MTERQILRNAIHIRRSENFGFAHRAPAFRTFANHQMAAPGTTELDLASTGNFEPFGHRFSGFNPFWTTHTIISFCAGAKTPHAQAGYEN